MPLRSRCWCEAEGITLLAKLVNASEGGVFVGTHAPLRSGSVARLCFCARGRSREISAQAVVVWVREAAAHSRTLPGMGLRFTCMDDPSAVELRSLVGDEGLARD